VWDVRTGKPMGQPLHRHVGEVIAVAVSPDGRTLVSGGQDGTVRLWDVPTHQQLGQPLRMSTWVTDVAFSPDGRAVAAADQWGNLRRWDGILWRSRAGLERTVCRLVVGDLTRDEWEELVPGLPYRRTCPR